MNIKLFKVVFFCFFICNAFSTSSVEARTITLEGKGSYFLSTNHRFRSIYGGAGLYRIETNIQIWNDLYAWANAGYMYASGDSSRGNHTHLHLVPVSGGVSYFWKVGSVSPYVGVGPILAYSHISNHATGVTRNQDGFGGGFVVKTGANFYFYQSLFVDVFTDYSFIRVAYHHSDKRTTHHKGDLSGFNFGLGLGYRF
ncbi:hypothetical protein [Simkania sp.]|uniref:hypothetical protein n=1 Tax=Simkania sp. TaxID=34094 RepID=UPI003B5256CF